MVLSTELIMSIGHRKEVRKQTFRALALRRSESDWIRSDEGLTLETSASESLYGGQYTLSTQLIKPNYLLKIARRVSTTMKQQLSSCNK